MLPQYFVFISIFTTLFAGYFYIRDTLRGTTKPNRATWFIWFIAPVTAALIQFANGADISALPIFMAGFVPFFVFIASFRDKHAYWKLNSFDYVCFALSIISFLTFVFFKEGTIATIFAILSDLIAFVPTWKKSWTHPDTETLSSYYSGAFNAALSLLTLTLFSFATAGFAVYLFFGNLIEVSIVLWKRNTRELNHEKAKL
jgi:hypothetical protein